MRVLLAAEPLTTNEIADRLGKHPGVEWVDAAAGVQDAIARERAQEFDLVVCSAGCRFGGPALIRELRTRGRELPILFIADEADRAAVVDAIRSGCSDYLISPFSSSALAEKLEKWGGACAGAATRTAVSHFSSLGV